MKLKEMKIGKLNILDLAIILIIIIFIGIFILNKISNSTSDGTNITNSNVTTTFSYTFLIESLSETSKDMLKIGDDVYDKVSNVCIGKITNLEIANAKDFIEKNNGEIVEAEIPTKIDVKLTIETNGEIRNGEYLANNLIRIMVGNIKQIKTKYLMCSGTVIGIEK